MRDFDIRPARPDDAAHLKILNDEFNGGDGDTEHIARCLASDSGEVVCIARYGEEPAGFCCARIAASICYMHPCGEITEMYVREKFRRRGVASRLMALAEEICVQNGVNELRVVTGSENAAAQAMYRAMGYVAEDEISFSKNRN